MTREEALAEEEDDDLEDFPEEEDDDGEPDEKTEIVSIHRLSSVDSWEMFRLRDEDTGSPLASIAVSAPRNGAQTVDYAVWRTRDREDPGFTGSLHRKAEPGVPATEWDDGAREEVLRQMLLHHEADLGVKQDKVEFQLAPPEGSDDAVDDDPEDES